MSKSERILLFSLESINNAGDEILRVTTEYLIRQVSSSDVQHVQLKPRKVDFHGAKRICWYIGAVLRRISTFMPLSNMSFRLKNAGYVIAYKSYFWGKIRKVNKVILPIGMLKYSTQDFSYLFNLITTICSKLNKPVLMSGMSPEMGNPNDWRYRQLVKAVNASSVKMITTRDGQKGVDIIKSQYLKRDIPCDYVGDPALWIPETYKVKRCESKAPVPIIGVNIIRKGIFEDYNKSYTDNKLFTLYSDLLRQIEAKGWGWKLFCNGMKKDWEVIKDLTSFLNVGDEKKCPIPSNGDEFVTMVSTFDAVFGARLHSCITSVSLGVPVVGFIWDEKIKNFSETMKADDFFFKPSDMTAEKVVNALEMAMNSQIDTSIKDKYKQKTLESIRYFIESY